MRAMIAFWLVVSRCSCRDDAEVAERSLVAILPRRRCMAALQDLELDYNCGLCGSLPSFPMQVLAMSIVLIPQIHYSQGLTVCWYLSHIFSNLNFVAQS